MRQVQAALPIVNADGTMQLHFQDFMNLVGRYLPIIGAGTPEGVVTAPQFSLYIDENGVAGSIEYRKMSAEIGGDRSKGWVQV